MFHRVTSHHSKGSVLMCRIVAKMMLDMNSALNFLQYVCSARSFRQGSCTLLQSMFKCCTTRCMESHTTQNGNVLAHQNAYQSDISRLFFRCCSEFNCKESNRVESCETDEIELSGSINAPVILAGSDTGVMMMHDKSLSSIST